MGELFIGIDIGGTKTSISLGNRKGKIKKKEVFATYKTMRATLDNIIVCLDRLIRPSTEPITAIGISCGGPLDSKQGIILSPPNLPDWRNVPIVSLINDQFGIPVFLENDANAGALAEWYWGNGKSYKNLVFLTFGTGLGAGLILNGRLYSGAIGLAGEVGHMRLAEDGPYCYGKHGSWESFCSGSGISSLYKDKYGIELSAKDICTRAESGEPDAAEIIEISSRYLGKGIAILIDVLNPEVIIIGSIYTRSESLFKTQMEQVIMKEALHQGAESCTILPAGLSEELGDKAALGVAINGKRE